MIPNLALLYLFGQAASPGLTVTAPIQARPPLQLHHWHRVLRVTIGASLGVVQRNDDWRQGDIKKPACAGFWVLTAWSGLLFAVTLTLSLFQQFFAQADM